MITLEMTTDQAKLIKVAMEYGLEEGGGLDYEKTMARNIIKKIETNLTETL